MLELVQALAGLRQMRLGRLRSGSAGAISYASYDGQQSQREVVDGSVGYGWGGWTDLELDAAGRA